jgi:DMSO reductase anchor subunit
MSRMTSAAVRSMLFVAGWGLLLVSFRDQLSIATYGSVCFAVGLFAGQVVERWLSRAQAEASK